MILLIDNKSNMIRFCENDPDIYGLDVCYPNWKGYTKFLSDTGHTVVLSGPEAEEWLDHEGIYYVHVEDVANETYTQFKRRIDKLIEENKEYINSSTSYGKLIFSLDQNLNASDRWADNVIEVWRLNENDSYRVFLTLPEGRCNHFYASMLTDIVSEYDRLVGILEDEEKVSLEEVQDFEFNLMESDTLTGISVRLHMLQSLFEKNLIKNDNICECDESSDDEEEEEDECDAAPNLAYEGTGHYESWTITDENGEHVFTHEDDTYTIDDQDVSEEMWHTLLDKALEDEEPEDESDDGNESLDDVYDEEDSTEDEVWDEEEEEKEEDSDELKEHVASLLGTKEGREALVAAFFDELANLLGAK